MPRAATSISLSLLLALATGCTATFPVRSVGQQNLAMEASVGGPLTTALGPALPIPNSYVGARYGVLDDLDLSAQYNLTAPVIPGLALDMLTNVHWVPIQPGLGRQALTPERGWGVSGSFGLHWLSDLKSGLTLVPTIDLAAGWRYRWLNPFVGVAVAYAFPRPFGERDIPSLSPYLGVETILDRLALVLKVVFFDVAHNMYGSQAQWVHLHANEESRERFGVLGITLGVTWTFARERAR